MTKILIIEDTPANMRLVVGILEREGYIVTPAETAEQGIELAQQIRFDLILMDIQLPTMDGLTAIRILREIDRVKTTPIIALTAHAMKEEEAQILASGCDGYIAKPIRYKALLNTVQQYLNN